jgi:hypothetical protein
MPYPVPEEDLIGYLLDLLDPAERVAIAARIATDPETAGNLERLRAVAAPMLADIERDDTPEPPVGLAVRTIARVAEHVALHEPRPSEPAASESDFAALVGSACADVPPDLEFASGTRARLPNQTLPAAASASPVAPRPREGPELRSGLRLRADVLVAACIAFVAFGLVLSGVAKARYHNQVLACQNSLRTLYTGLSGYADADSQGRYPQVGTAEYPTADLFAASLIDRGFLPPDYKPGCPAASDCPAYTYTLGFRGPGGQVQGLSRPRANSDASEENDLMPIAADLPAETAAPTPGPISPHAACMNVLFVGGNVRFTSSPNVGPRGDDIYRNLFGQVAAGADRTDAVLGGSGDRP